MSRSMPPIDVRKSLYDTDGYRHTLVQATPVQILTLLEGFYWLWDRMSGLCLVEGMTGMRLSNTRPPREDVRARRQPVAETRAFLLAQEAVQSAAASAARAITLKAMFGDASEHDGTDPTSAEPPVRALDAGLAATPAQPARRPAPEPAPWTPAGPAASPSPAVLEEDRSHERPGALSALLVLGLVGLALLVPGLGPARDGTRS